MNKKQKALALSLLMTAALLGGCHSQQTGDGQFQTPLPTRKPGPLISVPDTSATEASTAPDADTESVPALEPVNRLSAIQWQTIPQLLSLGDGAVLACRNDYEEGKGTVNHLQVLQVYEDKVLAQLEIATPMELVQQQFPQGQFVLKDALTNTFYVYDRQLQLTDQFCANNVDGYFSYDLKNYYFTENHVLYRMEISSGNYARMNLEYDLRLDKLIGIHPDREILIAGCYLSFCHDATALCAIDCRSGQYLLLNESVSHLWFDGDAFYAAVTNDAIYGSDIVYGTLCDGVSQMVSTALLGSDTVSYTMLPGSGIMIHRTVDEENLSTTVYDLGRGGISSRLSQYDYTTATLGAVYLRQEQLIFGVYPQDEGFAPVVIDPKVLRYEKSLNVNKANWPALVDKNAILDYQAELQGPELPDSLQSLRQQADKLEEQFGVSVLIGDQTLRLCGSYAAVNGDPKAIGMALRTLEEALNQYPAGFLAQFQDGIGEGGLYFCLTGPLQGDLKPVGKAVKNRNRYEIALDITSEALSSTVHHELWHAIEMKVSPNCFDTPGWQKANPNGFAYYGHYDSGFEKLTKWTYAQSGAACHFVDPYSRINGREDRARLMEYVMATDATQLLRSKALREKLEIMSNVIRENFNTDGWQTPCWEQYL